MLSQAKTRTKTTNETFQNLNLNFEPFTLSNLNFEPHGPTDGRAKGNDTVSLEEKATAFCVGRTERHTIEAILYIWL